MQRSRLAALSSRGLGSIESKMSPLSTVSTCVWLTQKGLLAVLDEGVWRQMLREVVAQGDDVLGCVGSDVHRRIEGKWVFAGRRR